MLIQKITIDVVTNEQKGNYEPDLQITICFPVVDTTVKSQGEHLSFIGEKRLKQFTLLMNFIKDITARVRDLNAEIEERRC